MNIEMGVSSAAWANDSGTLYFQPGHQNILSVPVTGGTPQEVTSEPTLDLYLEAPRLTPGETATREALPPSRTGETDLETARRHADAGRLTAAAEICEAHLREHGASAEAYYLLGLVLDAGSDANAIDYYRKALYLEPNHYETLLQMAMLSQKNGEAGRADTFKSRALRLKLKP